MSDLLSFADFGIKRALELGADEAEIFLLKGDNTEVTLENNDIHLGSAEVVSGLGLRVFKNNGLGFASTNSIDEEEVEKAIERALRLAGHAPSEPWNELPDSAPLKRLEGLYDPESEGFQTEDALRLAAELLNVARDFDERVTIESGVFTATKGEEAIVNSRGVEAEEKTSNFLYYLFGMAIDGQEVSNLDFAIDFTHQVGKVDINKVAESFAERVISSLGAKSVESFEGPAILGPDVGRALLGSVVSQAVNSDNVQKGMSKFADRIEKEVVSADLTIKDDGLLADGFSTSAFDREGLPHRPNTLIEKGKLKSFIHNTKTANKGDSHSTGNASGDYRRPPTVGTTNFIMKGGESSFEEMVSETKHGIVVRSLSGFPETVSGDFSAVVKGGFLIENGEIIQPVTDTLISGNVFEIMKEIESVSEERETILSFTLPHIKISRLSVTGK
ncbi:MAG: TldD/PmbA family protein [Methanobacteriota archaeon]|nr:MAG: TldD/PmbA family protein [Euryarchaeota archaeon]